MKNISKVIRFICFFPIAFIMFAVAIFHDEAREALLLWGLWLLYGDIEVLND